MVTHRCLCWLAPLCVLLVSAVAQAEKPTLAIREPSSGVAVGPQSESFGLRINARVQARYAVVEAAADSVHQIQIRRARLKFKGFVFGPENRFYIQLGFSPHDMTGGLVSEDGSPRRVPLRDARIEFHQLPWAQLWLGQMKVPFSRERLVSDANLDMIDRSLLNQEFNMDRDIGAQLRGDRLGGFVSYAIGAFSGQGRNVYSASKPALSLVSRIQFLLAGPLDEKTEGDLQRSKRPGAGLGFAYSFHADAPGDQGVHGTRPADGGTADLEELTGDLVCKWRGWSLEAAAMARRGLRRPGDLRAVADAPRNGWGYLLQVGVLVPRTRLELVGRYSAVRPFSFQGEASALRKASELNAGVNYYLGGHDLKLEFDVGQHWEAEREGDMLAPQKTTVRLQVQMAI